MRRQRIDILMDDAEARMLADAARFHGVSRSALIRALVSAAYLEMPEDARSRPRPSATRQLALPEVA